MMGKRELGVILFGVGVVVALFLVIRRAIRTIQMPLIYLDQNALIELGVKARRADFRRKLDKVIGSGAMTVVVSSWHLIETANTSNLANAEELAEFIDSLKPAWLLERRNIQKLDVQEDFWRFLKLDFPR